MAEVENKETPVVAEKEVEETTTETLKKDAVVETPAADEPAAVENGKEESTENGDAVVDGKTDEAVPAAEAEDKEEKKEAAEEAKEESNGDEAKNGDSTDAPEAVKRKVDDSAEKVDADTAATPEKKAKLDEAKEAANGSEAASQVAA